MKDSAILDALVRPHDPTERMDPDFIITHRCARCGKLGAGPRKYLREALREHETRCTARNVDARPFTLLFPRSS